MSSEVLDTHYALSDETECGLDVVGHVFYTEESKLYHNRYSCPPVQHTCHKDFVTCKDCLRKLKE